MKRFYKKAEPGTAPGGHVVRLDGKTVKTPLGRPLVVPSAGMAAEMAGEWAAQGDEIAPATMPVTQLACTMIDKCGSDADRAEIRRAACAYAGSDLVCYFATGPQSLVARQEKLWLPLLAWIREETGVELETASGILYRRQDEAVVERISACVDSLGPAAFTAFQAVAAATGSAVIALALVRGRITAQEAHEAACVDETYQLEKWGADALAQKRLDALRAEIEAAARFLSYFS